MEEIKVKIKSLVNLPLAELNPFQDEIKVLEEPDYQRLKTEILKDGFSFFDREDLQNLGADLDRLSPPAKLTKLGIQNVFTDGVTHGSDVVGGYRLAALIRRIPRKYPHAAKPKSRDSI